MPDKLKIEILYPELCNLFGDIGNIRYLEKCIPDAEFIYTSFSNIPAFVSDDVDMIYMGASTEHSQEIIIKKLMPYRENIKSAIENKKLMLFTGNAMEILFKYIENDNGEKIDGLDIFDFYAKRNIMQRYNCLMLCHFNEIDIVGFKTQFTMTYGDNSSCFFSNVDLGIGINKKSMLEGIHVHNFFGTNIVGPLLVLNPYFTEYLIKLMGNEKPDIAFKEEVTRAYNKRLEEFKNIRIKKH